MTSLLRLGVIWICAGRFLTHSCFVSAVKTAPLPDLYEASLTELQAGLASGQFNSVDLIKVRPFMRLFTHTEIRVTVSSLRLIDE